MKALIRNLVTSSRAPAKMLDNSHSHPHPQRDNDDSFIMINQDGNTTRPTTPTKNTETPERESPVPNPLFTSPTDTADALRGSYPEDLIDEQDLVDENQENPMNKPLEDKINDTIFAWSWTDTADAHATAADLDDAEPVTPPESHSADLDQGTPMDIDPKPDKNYSPMARVFGLLNMWPGTSNVSSNASKTEKTKLDTISEEGNESMDTSTEPSENTSPNLNFAAPVNSPTDSALGAPMTAINSRTMQMSTFQLNQDNSYHTTPSGTAPPSYQTSPHLLPDFSQDTMQTIQPTSLLDDVSENPTTLTESASTITLTQDSFSAAINDEKQKMTELPPNPRPWGWNKPTTFLCLPQRLRQAIMINTVSAKDFQVRRLRVTVVDDKYKPPVQKYKWGTSNWNWDQKEVADNGRILEDYYEAFVFDEKVQTWGRVLKAVDESLAGDMKGVRRGWKKLGLAARKEKIRKMGWVGMVGSGWTGSF
ncbi:hypothetical protein EG327_008909 [Venturia inaequalis]|uniref:Uncharacterized protein n=1 Tax=Venturia inaequalis TaxID=5025 RepID=A0A8H3UQQ6_VENIN|nr:hypothetical protein EG327_008909 [Venturia inaequalis]